MKTLIFFISLWISISIQAAQISYSVHVDDIGWMNTVSNAATAGTTGESIMMQAIKITAEGLPTGCDISYRAHVDHLGWLPWVSSGEIAGTVGEYRSMQAIEIKLNSCDGWQVRYQTHVAELGWLDWVFDGEISGTVGEYRQIEAIKIELIEPINTPTPVHVPTSKSYVLSANNATGLDIQINVGEKITIQASGRVHTNINGNVSNCDIYTSANGLNSCSYNSTEVDKLHNMPFMSLIGKIDGKYYYIGSNFINTFNTNSIINLSINDWDISDNSGELTILVTREEEQCSDIISLSSDLKFHINKISYQSSILWADFVIVPHEEKILFEVVNYGENIVSEPFVDEDNTAVGEDNAIVDGDWQIMPMGCSAYHPPYDEATMTMYAEIACQMWSQSYLGEYRCMEFEGIPLWHSLCK